MCPNPIQDEHQWLKQWKSRNKRTLGDLKHSLFLGKVRNWRANPARLSSFPATFEGARSTQNCENELSEKYFLVAISFCVVFPSFRLPLNSSVSETEWNWLKLKQLSGTCSRGWQNGVSLICSENKSEEIGANWKKSEQIGVFQKTRNANRKSEENGEIGTNRGDDPSLVTPNQGLQSYWNRSKWDWKSTRIWGDTIAIAKNELLRFRLEGGATQHHSSQHALSQRYFRDRKGTPKNFCDKDFAELSGELSGAICLKALHLLGSALELFRKFFGAVRPIFWLGVLSWLLTTARIWAGSPLLGSSCCSDRPSNESTIKTTSAWHRSQGMEVSNASHGPWM